MPRPKPTEISPRKNIALPQRLWARIADYRFSRRVPSEAEAIRRLLEIALEAEEARDPAESGKKRV